MKTLTAFFSLVILLFIAPSSFSQAGSDSVKFEPHPDSAYVVVDVKAEHPGGEMGFRKFLERNLKASTPVDNGAPEGIYIVWTSCIIDSAGRFISVVPETKHGYGMEEEVVRVFKKMPNYKPAIKNRQPVKSKLQIPFTFVISVQ